MEAKAGSVKNWRRVKSFPEKLWNKDLDKILTEIDKDPTGIFRG